jgi:hypothetical protein
MSKGYSLFECSKPTSFWHLGSLFQAAHPATDVGEVVAVRMPKLGPFGSDRRVAMPGECPCPG